MINETIPLILDREQYTTYNTGCVDELNKVIQGCTDFKLHVIETMELRFIIALTIFLLLVMFRILTEYRTPKFMNNDYYRQKIRYRIDLLLVIFAIFIIFYMFFM